MVSNLEKQDASCTVAREAKGAVAKGLVARAALAGHMSRIVRWSWIASRRNGGLVLG
jgi:hypothetical protein